MVLFFTPFYICLILLTVSFEGVISKADLKAYIQRCSVQDAEEEEGIHHSLPCAVIYLLTCL